MISRSGLLTTHELLTIPGNLSLSVVEQRKVKQSENQLDFAPVQSVVLLGSSVSSLVSNIRITAAFSDNSSDYLCR